MKKPSIQVLDTDLSNKHSISGYISLEFTRAWNSQGYFKLIINKENRSAKYLAVDKILYIDEKRIGYINSRTLSKKGNASNALLTIEGIELKDELIRITYPEAEKATDSYNNQYTETVVKDLINKNAGISVLNSKRKIPNLETAADLNRGSQIIFSTRYKNLMAEIYNLLCADLMGLKCRVDFDSSKIRFDVEEGADKKAVIGTKAGVVLSVNLKTADEVKATEDKSSYKNVAIAAGLGSGAARTIQEVGETEKAGYARSETFVDARDVSSDAELTERGNQRLADTKTVKGKTIKFNELGPRMFDEAFTLGDFITADIDGEYEDAQVIKVTETYKGIKPPSISLVLDFDYLDSLAKNIKVTNENFSNVSSAESSGSSGTADIGLLIHEVQAKEEIDDSDEIGISDSEDSYVLKKFSWENIKASILSWLVKLGFCIRETLKENRTYYIKPGSGAVSGSGTFDDPFTGGAGDEIFQAAINKIASLDISIYTAKIDPYSAATHEFNTVTISNANPGVVTWISHGLSDGDMVKFSSTGALPTGIAADHYYYVVNSTTNSYEIEIAVGNGSIDTTGSQSGVHTAILPITYEITSSYIYCKDPVGAGQVYVDGNVSNEDDVWIKCSSFGFKNIDSGKKYAIRYMHIDGYYPIKRYTSGVLSEGGKIEVANLHISNHENHLSTYFRDGGIIEITGDMKFSGKGGTIWAVDNGKLIVYGSFTMNTDYVSFYTFLRERFQGYAIFRNTVSFTEESINGYQYSLYNCSVLYTSGVVFPGTLGTFVDATSSVV